jgi:ribonuclease HI
VAHGLADLDEFRARLAELRRTLEAPTGPGPFVAHTDGACVGNPDGPGGWAAAVEAGDETWDLWGHLSSTTNNRAEALGVLGALEWVPTGGELLIRSDSELTVRILEGRYKAKKNPDIWLEINRLRGSKDLSLKIEWVRGHVGDPGNEQADYLSRLGVTDGDALAAGRIGQSRPAGKPLPAELVGLVPQSDWEKNFLKSITQVLRANRPLSPKQQAIVDRMRTRGDGTAST